MSIESSAAPSPAAAGVAPSPAPPGRVDADHADPVDPADPGLWPAVRLAAAIRRRQLSSEELLDHFVARIETLAPQVNAVVTLDVERAREAARAADRATVAGGPL